MSYEPGDILLVYFPFEEGNGEKDRRAIFWDEHDGLMVMTKITSSCRRPDDENFKWQLPLNPDPGSGLKNRSYVWVDQTRDVDVGKIIEKVPLGSLSKMQLAIVKDALRKFLNG